MTLMTCGRLPLCVCVFKAHLQEGWENTEHQLLFFLRPAVVLARLLMSNSSRCVSTVVAFHSEVHFLARHHHHGRSHTNTAELMFNKQIVVVWPKCACTYVHSVASIFSPEWFVLIHAKYKPPVLVARCCLGRQTGVNLRNVSSLEGRNLEKADKMMLARWRLFADSYLMANRARPCLTTGELDAQRECGTHIRRR